ncbi:MAG: hypothetical protein J6N72_07965, partial [Psychrobacter sp.]|nr:hypothetical protein [Psychrobacter sp.]
RIDTLQAAFKALGKELTFTVSDQPKNPKATVKPKSQFMNTYSSLFAEITTHMLGITITQPNFQKNVIKNTGGRFVLNEDGTYSCMFRLIVEAGSLDFRFDDKRVTKAALVFFLTLDNCTYTSEKGWSWDEMSDKYRIISGQEEPNVITYDCQSPLNNDASKGFYSGGLTKEQDISLANNIPVHMLRSTPRSLLIMVIKDLLSTPAPLKHQ